MTSKEMKEDLALKLNLRAEAWKTLGTCNVPLKRMSPERRQQIEEAAEAFHRCDVAIVEILNEAGRPVAIEYQGRKVVLHLMADQEQFVVLDAKSKEPFFWNPTWGRWTGINLYRGYPKARAS